MTEICARCKVPLLTDAEINAKYPGGLRSFVGEGASFRMAEYEAKKQRDLDAHGVMCGRCGKGFCVLCMKKFGTPHRTAGGLACLDCGGPMVRFERKRPEHWPTSLPEHWPTSLSASMETVAPKLPRSAHMKARRLAFIALIILCVMVALFVGYHQPLRDFLR
jgi:hypothetical protein